MYQAGLILEGGGMRGVYTAGVLDAFLDYNLEFSSIYGVSAGSCHACSYMSKQRGRAFRVNVDYLEDPSYCSVKSLVKTGNLFGADMLYSRIPDVLDPFDHEAFRQYPGNLYAVLTNLDTGEAEYHRVKDLEKQMWAIRASSSLPLLSKTIVVKGNRYLDGGVADSIPIERSIKAGNQKNVIILTRDRTYRKEPNPMMAAVKLRYKAYPEFVQKMEDRHERYNATMDYIEKEETAGNLIVIRPKEPVQVDRLEKNREKLQSLYHQGYADGKEAIEAIEAYMEQE